MQRWKTALCALGLAACADPAMMSETSDPAIFEEGRASQALALSPRFARFKVRLENVNAARFLKSGAFSIPVGKSSAGPIRPGDSYQFTFTAGKSHRLSFVTMLGASNDWFLAPGPEGIPLFVDGQPISGDLTTHLRLYDAGTEVDQEPAVGPDTGPKQAAPGQGAADRDRKVREVSNPAMLADGSSFALPAVSEMISASIQPTSNPHEFRVEIRNVAGSHPLMTSAGPAMVGFSPGVYVIHADDAPLFQPGTFDRDEGLEAIAESGAIQTLATVTQLASGVATGFSPTLFALHTSGAPLFSPGHPDRGFGLERIAEEGDAASLAQHLTGELTAVGVAMRPLGSEKSGPIKPGQAYEVTVIARAGDRLTLATMYGASNDWFVSTGGEGLDLFDLQGQPISGNRSSKLRLWNAGTEVDQEPAVGPDTAPNQPAPDTGAVDARREVRLVMPEEYRTPITSHLKLTVSAY
jgi:hypothetical protein